MKSKIYLIAFLAILFSCTGENQKGATVEISGTMKQNEIAGESTYATAVNIKDIFLLLPDDAFPEAISVANRKLLLNSIGEDKAYDISSTPIDVCDVKNGYLSLTGMQFGWEMCYWNLKDSRKLVAINNGTESGSEIRTFFYQNGKLTEDPNYRLGGNQNYKLTDFINVSQLSADTRKFAEKQFAKGDYIVYYQLPQKGTSLKLNIDTYQFLDYDEAREIPYEAIKEVTLKWNNEKWER